MASMSHEESVEDGEVTESEDDQNMPPLNMTDTTKHSKKTMRSGKRSVPCKKVHVKNNKKIPKKNNNNVETPDIKMTRPYKRLSFDKLQESITGLRKRIKDVDTRYSGYTTRLDKYVVELALRQNPATC